MLDGAGRDGLPEKDGRPGLERAFARRSRMHPTGGFSSMPATLMPHTS